MLSFRQLGTDDDILDTLHTEMIPEKDEGDLIGKIHRRFGTMLRNMNRSPLHPGMRLLIIILLLCYWLGQLTSKVGCWVT